MDALLDELTPEQFDELWASDRLDFAGERRTHRLLASLCAILHNHTVVATAAAYGQPADERLLRSELDFLSPGKSARNEPRRMTAQEAEAYAAARYGPEARK